jgi:hypothetical protein
LDRQTDSKQITHNPYLEINRIKGIPYVKLAIGKRRIYLGSLKPDQPTSLLDVVIMSLDRLTIDQIRALQRADKSMREPGRRPGPHRPKQWFGSRF